MAEYATFAILSGVVSAAQAAMSAAQTERRTNAETTAANAAAQRQMEQQQLAAQIEERRRQEELRRQQGTRLAAFGGRGIASTGGSADAVIAGLGAESARRGAEGARMRTLAASHSLLDLADRNKLALMRAAEARENAALNIVNSGLGTGKDLARTGFFDKKGAATRPGSLPTGWVEYA